MERHHYLEIIGITEGDREVAQKIWSGPFHLVTHFQAKPRQKLQQSLF